jgi:hypothetical protein
MKDDPETQPTMKVVHDEASVAADLKERMRDALKTVCAIMDEAASKGLVIQFQSITTAPPLGKHAVIDLKVISMRMY